MKKVQKEKLKSSADYGFWRRCSNWREQNLVVRLFQAWQPEVKKLESLLG